MSAPNPPIVKLSLQGRPAQGVPFAITIEIGAPYDVTSSRHEEWACLLTLHPFLPRPRTVHGGDSLQALSLALCLVGDLLQDFQDKGGTLLDDTGDTIDLAPYRFGNFKPSQSSGG